MDAKTCSYQAMVTLVSLCSCRMRVKNLRRGCSMTFCRRVNVKVVDLNGDGNNEFLVSSFDINSLFIYKSDEDGDFCPSRRGPRVG